jgi:hypothetical protein
MYISTRLDNNSIRHDFHGNAEEVLALVVELDAAQQWFHLN